MSDKLRNELQKRGDSVPCKKKLIAGGWFRSNVLPVMSG